MMSRKRTQYVSVPGNPAAKGRLRGLSCLRLLSGTRGGQLLEFAFSLPFLAVIAVGIMDFGEAYNMKHKLTNAAREGARITVSNPLTNSNCTTTTPCSITAAATEVQQYMLNASLSKASCITPDSPSSSGANTWTWTCNSITLTIDKGFVITPSGSTNVIPATHVTLSYPYTWSFGTVIKLLGGNSSSMPSTLSSEVIMQNLA